MARKNYDAVLARREPPNFTVAGQDFDCRSKLSVHTFKKLMKMVTAADIDEVEAAEKFISQCLVRADRERFISLLHDGQVDGAEGDEDELDDENVIEPGQLTAIVDDLMGYYTGKPSESDISSSPGPQQTQASQNVRSLNPRTISA